MASSVNRPNRITLDAYSDPQLLVKSPGGAYSSFTNVLKNPIIGAKGLQLSERKLYQLCLTIE